MRFGYHPSTATTRLRNINIRQIIRFVGCALIFSPIPFPAAAEDFTNAIHAFLQHRVKTGGIDGCIVGEQGSRVVGCGKLDNGTDQEANGDTVFDIHSTSCVFTRLLLQDMPDGMIVKIWREGDYLAGQSWDKKGASGAFEIYPESETNFFLKLDGSQDRFIKNEKGEVTAVIHHFYRAGVSDVEGRKLKDE